MKLNLIIVNYLITLSILQASTLSFAPDTVKNPSASNNGPLTCIRTAVTLTAEPSTGVSYLWSTGDKTQKANVTQPGTYTVTMTDVNDMTTAVASTVVTQDIKIPNAIASNDGPLTCVKQIVTLTAQPSTGVWYLWSVGSTTQTSTTSVPGTYTVTVSNNSNGCTASASTIVTQDIQPPTSMIQHDGPFFCGKKSVKITALPATGVTYTWSTGASTQTTTIGYPGSYTVTITSNNGCTSSVSINISNSYSLLEISKIPKYVCDDSLELKLITQYLKPPFDIVWSDPTLKGTNVKVFPDKKTTYYVTLIDSTGLNCPDSITIEPALTCSSPIVIRQCNKEYKLDLSTALKYPTCSGHAYEFIQNKLENFINYPEGSVGTFIYTIKDITTNKECSNSITFSPCIEGKVYHDINSNCIINTLDSLATIGSISFEKNNTFFTSLINIDGSYRISLDTGNYKLSYHSIFRKELFCANSSQISNNSLVNLNKNLIIDGTNYNCWDLRLSGSLGNARRCEKLNANIVLNNIGFVRADNSYIILEHSDKLKLVNSNYPFSILSSTSIRIEIGNINPSQKINLDLVFTVDCVAPLNTDLCVILTVFPESNCQSIATNNNSILKANISCNGNLANVQLKNIGGLILENKNISIHKNNLLQLDTIINLNPNQEINLIYPLDNQILKLISGSQDCCEYKGMIYLSKAGCTTPSTNDDIRNFYSGLQFNSGPLNELVLCTILRAAYDPNDKSANPTGLGPDHKIENDSKIKYQIRFQNVGNDYARHVFITDTLSQSIDPSSIQIINASHNYTVDYLPSGVLQFYFKDIYLPDSATSQEKSNGFISFEANLKPNLPIGTRIENTAYIYFDFNEAVITNTVFHTIGKDIFTNTNQTQLSVQNIQLLPNVVNANQLIRIVGTDSRIKYVELYSTLGNKIKQINCQNNSFTLSSIDLSPGTYFVKLDRLNVVIPIVILEK